MSSTGRSEAIHDLSTHPERADLGSIIASKGRCLSQEDKVVGGHERAGTVDASRKMLMDSYAEEMVKGKDKVPAHELHIMQEAAGMIGRASGQEAPVRKLDAEGLYLHARMLHKVGTPTQSAAAAHLLEGTKVRESVSVLLQEGAVSREEIVEAGQILGRKRAAALGL
jgi:hypothetical protein